MKAHPSCPVFVVVTALGVVVMEGTGDAPGGCAGDALRTVFFIYKSPLTRSKPLDVRGYKPLQQQELECCEIVIWWKAFISKGVPKGCRARKKV